MYAYLHGILKNSSPLSVVIEAQGVGFRVWIPANAFSQLPAAGEHVLLHTSYVIREFAHTLYGFLSTHERDIFEMLMEITGVGPKMALSIVGNLSTQDLLQAVQQANVNTLSKVPGVGKKTAERLVMELRDKLAKVLTTFPENYAIAVPSDPQAQTVRDAMSALVHLGYHQLAAQSAIKKALQEFGKDSVELSTLITHALNHLK